MKTYSYATDSSSGTIKADSLQAAYDAMRTNITDTMVEDGATLWVEDESGERITMDSEDAGPEGTRIANRLRDAEEARLDAEFGEAR